MRLSLEEITARLQELEGLAERVERLEQGLQRYLPQPNPTVIMHDPGAPQPTEKTTLAPVGHPDWVRPRRMTKGGGFDDAA